ncbi:DUF4136 domain-containing protein [Maribacter chungangensis]|uniref:DUF4136 domain-containing protein n=1 Tax=Maribacter chungangensis TaxID=1069117 RepID=A0ABW3B653_9FLAO
MKRVMKMTLALVAMVLATSCGPTLSTTKMTDKNLADYKTFAYLPSTNFEVPDDLATNDRVAQSVIKAMNENMKDARYEINRKNPDLLVLLTTKFDKEPMRDVDAIYASYPYDTPYPVSPYYENYYYWDYERYTEIIGYDVDYSSYKIGTLIVDIVDRKTKKRLWTGTAEQAIYQQDTSDKVAEYVDAIFDEYPKTSK